MKVRFAIFVIMLLTVSGMRASEPCDSCACAGPTRWIGQLIDNGFRINDSSVCYPRFPRFALKVYNWGDRTFNSYNRDYVVGTGKNWKIQAKSYSWLETTSMIFPKKSQVQMHSDLFSDAGFSLSFMAVSLGYMWNVNSLFNKPTKRRTFNFDFTTSRFNLSYQSSQSSGGMIVTRFGEYKDGGHIHYRLNDVSMKTKTFYAYYFFNHNRYSHAACHTFSKYQLRSAGTPLVGISIAEQNIYMDFMSMPPAMLLHNPLITTTFSSHYRAYTALGGYAYNWVLSPRKWCVHATGMFATGYRRTYDKDEVTELRELVANVVHLNLAAVYNHRALFCGLNLRAQGFFNYSSQVTHFNSIVSLTATVGARF